MRRRPRDSTLKSRLDRASGKVHAPVFFVVAMGKSGTGWRMKLLDTYPEVLCRGEGKHFGQDWTEKTLKRIRAGEERTTNRPPGSLYGAMMGFEALRF